jgi:hypothetical protein
VESCGVENPFAERAIALGVYEGLLSRGRKIIEGHHAISSFTARITASSSAVNASAR